MANILGADKICQIVQLEAKTGSAFKIFFLENKNRKKAQNLYGTRISVSTVNIFFFCLSLLQAPSHIFTPEKGGTEGERRQSSSLTRRLHVPRVGEVVQVVVCLSICDGSS